MAGVMRSFAGIRCSIDASPTEFITGVEERLNEFTDYQSHIARKRSELMLPPGRNPTLEYS